MRKRLQNKRQGAAMVELAVLLPFLLYVFMVAVDFGRIFYFSQIITNCARNGALYASDPSAPAFNLYANVQSAALVDANGLFPSPIVSSTTGNDAAGNPFVRVTVAWTFQTLTNFPGIPNSTQLSRTCQMRLAPQ